MDIKTMRTFDDRINILRNRKMDQTQEKWDLIGSMDYDDWALILPSPEHRKIVQTISGSGVPIVDVILDGPTEPYWNLILCI